MNNIYNNRICASAFFQYRFRILKSGYLFVILSFVFIEMLLRGPVRRCDKAESGNWNGLTAT